MSLIDPKRDPQPIAPTILWRTLWGSHMWGMETPESDRDRCTVYQLDHRTITLGAFRPSLLQRHRTGWHSKSAEGDEHWFEIGRVIQLLSKGSLTMLHGVVSPIVVEEHTDALSELRALLERQPSRGVYKALLRDVAEAERLMERTRSETSFLKQLRIATRNLKFGITLFREGRYAYEKSVATRHEELKSLREEARDAYESSSLPAAFDCNALDGLLLRWRERQYLREKDCGTNE